ncbi:hypothetical protein ACP0HM_33340 [Escherichia coli]
MFRRKPIPTATGPVNDLELALFPDVHGDLSIEILANKQRYDEPTLIQHAERLKNADCPVRRGSGAVVRRCRYYAAGEYAQLAQLNATQVEIPETTLSALVAEQAAKKHRMLRRWQMRVTCSAIGKCASRWWRWRICCVSAALNRGTAWRWHYRARSFDPGTPCDS